MADFEAERCAADLCRVFLGWRLREDYDALLALEEGALRVDVLSGEAWCDGDPLPPYVRLINDVLMGDRSLFTRPDGLAAVWDAAGPLLDSPPKPKPYAPGSWGPEAADKLAEPDGWLLGQ